MTSARALVAPGRARHALPSAARLGCGLLVLLLSACGLAPGREESMPPLDGEVRAGIGAVNVVAVAGPDGAQHGAVKPVSPGEAAGAWALGSTLESAVVDPFLLPIGALIGIFGAPIAAVSGSISPQKIEGAEHAIRNVLTDPALINSLRANVTAAPCANLKCASIPHKRRPNRSSIEIPGHRFSIVAIRPRHRVRATFPATAPPGRSWLKVQSSLRRRRTALLWFRHCVAERAQTHM